MTDFVEGFVIGALSLASCEAALAVLAWRHYKDLLREFVGLARETALYPIQVENLYQRKESADEKAGPAP